MYGIDESGYYSIDIPEMPPISALKAIMKKGHIAHLGAKALDHPLSFEGFMIVNVKVLSIEDEYEGGCNFKVLVMDDPDKELTGSLITSTDYCDGFIHLDLSWGDSHKTLAKLHTITSIVKGRSFNKADHLTSKSYELEEHLAAERRYEQEGLLYTELESIKQRLYAIEPKLAPKTATRANINEAITIIGKAQQSV